MSNLDIRTVARLAVTSFALALAGCGGGASTESNPVGAGSGPVGGFTYSGPAPATDDVQAFRNELWNNLIPVGTAACGDCHSQAGGQAPMFARFDDVNAAYSEALPLVDRSQAGLSRLVTKVGGGHNCWLASPTACADIMTTWIENWFGGPGAGGRQILLEAPPISDPGTSKNFPATYQGPPDFTPIHNLLTQYCSDCHSSTGEIAQQAPFFAESDIAEAYEAAKPKIDLNDPPNSRFVLRLGEEFHNCWSDCEANANEMLAAIQTYANNVTATTVDPNLVISKALRLIDGTVASGGNRYENNQIALWEFKEDPGSPVAFDTSGISPAANLTLDPNGDLDFIGGWGLEINSGRAQALVADSQKLYDLITLTGEYSIEAWVVPANVVQEEAPIISYAVSPDARNFQLGQTIYSYDFYNRTDSTGGDGGPVLTTSDADEDLQATLQHVVATYDPVNGRQIYVNGVFTDDMDPSAAGSLADWDNSFAFMLGGEPSPGNEAQWQGVIRMVAIHNEALTEAQIQQNLEVGVGEKFFLLFFIGDIIGEPDSYIMFEVAQFDSYSYLFNEPVYLSLNSSATVSNVPLQGMRIGLNGQVLDVGQAYANLNVSLNDTAGQPLSNLGTVVPLERGPDADEFFLSFDQLGGQSGPVTPPTSPTPPPELVIADQPDIGLRTFDEINHTMSAVTTVPVTEVEDTFDLVRQQLPSISDVGTFSSAQEIGIAQLAVAYCDALIENDLPRRAAYFPNFTTNFGQIPSTAYGGGNRDDLINPLVDRIVGVGLLDSQPAFADVVDELGYATSDGNRPDNLIDRLIATDNSSAERTEDIAKATCSALLASGVALIQ